MWGFCDREGYKVLMGARGEDSVEPGLFVLVAGGGECCARELLCIKSKRRLLRGIAVGREGAYTYISKIL